MEFQIADRAADYYKIFIKQSTNIYIYIYKHVWFYHSRVMIIHARNHVITLSRNCVYSQIQGALSSSVLRNAYHTVRAHKCTCMCTSEHVITGLSLGKRVCFLTSSSDNSVRHWAHDYTFKSFLHVPKWAISEVMKYMVTERDHLFITGHILEIRASIQQYGTSNVWPW